jgi:hypothetical protein
MEDAMRGASGRANKHGECSARGPWTVRAVVAALVLGAAYLYSVRGGALLMDLASGAAGLLCW